jgi:hypothetical protein
MIQVSFINGYLIVTEDGFLKAYSFSAIENITSFVENGQYYVKISFIADKGCPQDPLKIPLGTIINQPGWENTWEGANTAVEDITAWGQAASTTSLLATEDTLLSIKTILDPSARIPGIIRTNVAGTINFQVYDFAVANTGLTNGLILGQTIKPDEVIEFDGGAVSNYYPAGTITYDGTGTELLITFNT